MRRRLVRERIDWRNSGQVECYEYDGLNRLTRAFTSDEIPDNPQDCTNGYQNVGDGAYEHSYTYNAVGNLTAVDSTTDICGAGTAGPHALT